MFLWVIHLCFPAGFWLGILICVVIQSTFYIIVIFRLNWKKMTEEVTGADKLALTKAAVVCSRTLWQLANVIDRLWNELRKRCSWWTWTQTPRQARRAWVAWFLLVFLSFFCFFFSTKHREGVELWVTTSTGQSFGSLVVLAHSRISRRLFFWELGSNQLFLCYHSKVILGHLAGLELILLR